MIRATGALFALTLPAAAQTLSGPESDTLPRLIASACFDLIEDRNGCETVILLASETEPDTADLLVLTDRRIDPAGAPLLVARGIVFNGPLWGMSPWLEQAENGSLLVQSEQTGIGRFPWTQTLTLAWRDGEFVVAGYTRSTYDRITASSAGCDVNLLTGDYVIEALGGGVDNQPESVLVDRTGRGAPMVLPATAWTIETPSPTACEEAFTLLYGG
jgi:hypothetical protein